jgi:LysM repeat protein
MSRAKAIKSLSNRLSIVSILFFAINIVSAESEAQSLAGSRLTMQRQNLAAVNYGYSFLNTGSEVLRFVDAGYLEKVNNSRFLELHSVSYPYARPEVKMFVERLSQQYFAACGEKMTVTSLTRPINKQPQNASTVSVHPTGMAVDLRIPQSGRCRRWLQDTLLSLEGRGVLDVTRERYPPHFHVAVFTRTYANYVANMKADSSEYEVRPGDTLSKIASQRGLDVNTIRKLNNISGDLIVVGQILSLPGKAKAADTSVKIDSKQPKSMQLITHKVRRGENLWRIASRYGTSVKKIREQNNLNSDLLQVGQVLQLVQ